MKHKIDETHMEESVEAEDTEAADSEDNIAKAHDRSTWSGYVTVRYLWLIAATMLTVHDAAYYSILNKNQSIYKRYTYFVYFICICYA